MKIHVEITRLFTAQERNRLRAYATVSIDGMVRIHRVKVIQGADRLFVAMPTSYDFFGNQFYVVHLSQEVFEAVSAEVLAAYCGEVGEADILT
jgi:stage V sporulation protein G